MPLSQSEFGPLLMPSVVLAGAVGSVTSGCNIALLAAAAGFAGSREKSSPGATAAMAACFTGGTIASMAAIGALVGLLGGGAGAISSRVGNLLAGFLCILFALAALDLLPFRVPSLPMPKSLGRAGLGGASAFGLASGAASAACCMGCCAPVLPAVMGLAALEGNPAGSAGIMALFGLGYSVPFAVALLGLGAGRMSGLAPRLDRPLRLVSGVLLLGAGFWLLATLK